EQTRSGHDIAVVLPKYDIIELSQIEDLKIYKLDLWSFEDAFKYHNTVWTGVYDSIRIYLIEPHHNQYYFNRGQVYGCMNDIERFLYFSRAALEFLHKEQKDIDVLHIHDWPTAVVAPL